MKSNWNRSYFFLVILGFSLSTHAYSPSDGGLGGLQESGTGKLLGLEHAIKLSTSEDGDEAPSILDHVTLPTRSSCSAPDNIENKAQFCEVALAEAKANAEQFAQERAQDEAEKIAVEKMKEKKSVCDYRVGQFKNNCVSVELQGVKAEGISGCADMLPLITSAKETNSGLLDGCRTLFETLKEPCTTPAVGEVRAQSVSESGRSSNGYAQATAYNPKLASFPIQPEEDMVAQYQNMLANFNKLESMINAQVADLDRATTQTQECVASGIAGKTGDISGVSGQQMSYTEDAVDLGLETSGNNVGLQYFSRRAAEADAAAAWEEQRQREADIASGKLAAPTTVSDATPDYISTYRPSNYEAAGTPEFYQSAYRSPVPVDPGGGGTVTDLLGGQEPPVTLPITMDSVPIPRPRPANLETSPRTTPTTTRTATNPTQPQTSTPTSQNKASDKYLDNTNAYGGGTTPNAGGGLNPSQMLAQLGQNATASEKVGQYNGVDYSGNSYYGNANGRYSGSTDNYATTSGGGNLAGNTKGFVRENAAIPTGARNGFNTANMYKTAGNFRGGSGSSYTGFQGAPTNTDGSGAGSPEGKAGSAKDSKFKKGGNKQVFSSKTEGGQGGGSSFSSDSRILSENTSRSPASNVEDKYKNAKKRGEGFDPSKYEPRDLAARKAYERVTGRHVAGRRSNGLPWPRDIRQCKRPDSCKDVFGHMSDQFRVQFLMNGI